MSRFLLHLTQLVEIVYEPLDRILHDRLCDYIITRNASLYKQLYAQVLNLK